MPDLPIILSYFAQHKSEENQDPNLPYLPLLNKEYGENKSCWEKVCNKAGNPFPIIYLSRNGEEATSKKLEEDLIDYQQRIVLFQFSGHAGSNQFLFNGGTAHANGFAGYLKGWAPNLKIVILNGCSTAEDVEDFFAQGIKIVVATKCDVYDEHAKLFSTAFHRTLSNGGHPLEAYQAGVNNVKKNPTLRDALPSRLLDRGNAPASIRRGIGMDANRNEGIWDIFVRDENVDWLTDKQWWRLEYADSQTNSNGAIIKKTPKVLREDLAYCCDRTVYVDAFYPFFDLRKNPDSSPVQNYLIVGESSQSPLGLARMLAHEYVTSIDKYQNKYFYSCDPVDINKRINYIQLKRRHSTALDIALAIFEKVPEWPSANELESEIALFAQMASQLNRWAFSIIAIGIDYVNLTDPMIQAVCEFNKQLAQAVRQRDGYQSRGLFFWYISSRPQPTSGPPVTVKMIAEQFGEAVSTTPKDGSLWLLNDQYQSPEIPTNTDIQDWLNDYINPFKPPSLSRQNDLSKISDVEVLESELLGLINETNEYISKSRQLNGK
ncbi:hypothetical protein ACWKW6_02455 [Dyadobacter jiangsuensis]